MAGRLRAMRISLTLVLGFGCGLGGAHAAGTQASGMTATGLPAATTVLSASLTGLSDADREMVTHGHYLATAADCAACHTASGGKDFAGGYPIASPLGTIYSSNITPSKTAGIGNYSETDFARALREGIRRDGGHLYPAMPYTSYSGLSDKDVAALYAYFMRGVTPVDQVAPRTALPFPFNIRASMAAWNLLFLNKPPAASGPQQRSEPTDRQSSLPGSDQSAELQRGAYLVQDLAHCAECHTPRNALMALDRSADLTGGAIGSWYAPNITNDPVEGIGQWSDAALRDYLKTGRATGMAQAAGPMAEAITNSLQYLSDADVSAIIAYLRTTRTSGGATAGQAHNPSTTPASRAGFGAAHSAEATYRGVLADSSSGAQLYSGNCAACHRADGSGSPDGAYPALFGNTATGATHPNNLIATILFGVNRTVGGKQVLMPGFGPHAYVNRLSDQEIADLSNYVLKQYGNPDVTVTASDVATIAQGGPTPLIATLGKYAGVAIATVAVILILVLLIVIAIVRRKQTRPLSS